MTITLDPIVRRHAKAVAKRRGTTVSGLIETLLSAQTATKKTHVDAMLGIGRDLLEPSAGTDPRYDYLKAKYLKPAGSKDRPLLRQTKSKTKNHRENSN